MVELSSLELNFKRRLCVRDLRWSIVQSKSEERFEINVSFVKILSSFLVYYLELEPQQP